MAKTQCAVPGCKNTASKRYDDRPAVCLSCYRTLPRNGNVPVIPGLDDEPQAVEADSIHLAHNDTPEPKRLWRQGIDVLHQVQKLSDRSRGRIETHIATQILTDTPVAIMWSADWHLGSLSTDARGVEKHLDLLINSPELRMVTVGDLIENTRVFRSLEAVTSQSISPELQMDIAEDLIEDLSSRDLLLAAFWGNHDVERDERLFGSSPLAKIFAQYSVPYFAGIGVMDLIVGSQTYKIVATHKYKGNSATNDLHSPNKLHMEKCSDADVAVTAHTHRPAHSTVFRYLGGIERQVELIKTGTYKSDDVFSVRHFSPGVVGVPTTVFYPHHKEMITFSSPMAAVTYIRAERRVNK